MKDNTIEAEIVEDEFLAPVLKNAKALTTLVNTDELIKEYSELANIGISTPVEEIALKFIEIEKGFKAFRKARTSIEKTRKEIGEPAFHFHKKVIEIAKEIQKTINPYEDKLKALVDKVENEEKRKQIEAEEAEEARIHKIKSMILDIKNLPLQHFNSSSDALTKTLESLRVVASEEYEEFYDEAVENQNYVISQLQTARSNKVLVENAEKIQAEREQKAKEEEDERLELQKEKQAKIDKEREDFEREKNEFAQKQKELQEQTDAKKADEEAEELLKKQEAEKIAKEEADKELYEKRFNEAWDDLNQAFANKDEALLDLIIEGKIRHVKWSPDGN